MTRPRRPGPAASDPVPAAPLVRLLVVGDPGPVRAALASLPGPARVDLIAAADAEAAVERLPAGLVDVLLTDLQLPGRSGIWLAEWIAVHAPAVRVVLMSASLPPSGTVFPPSVRRFVRKPIQSDVLLAILGDAPGEP